MTGASHAGSLVIRSLSSPKPQPLEPQILPPPHIVESHRTTLVGVEADPDYESCSVPRNDLPSAAKAIPKIFHTIWLGDPMPREYRRYYKSWQDKHPDWDFVLWTDSNLLPLHNQDIYERASTPAQKADIARLEILYQYGGVYKDADLECFRSIDELTQDLTFWLSEESQGQVCNSIMGCVPHHPFFERATLYLRSSYLSNPDASPVITTGPRFLARLLDEWIQAGFTPPHIFPPKYFFPYRGDERHRRYERFPEAYGAHHWGGSWIPSHKSPKERLRQLLMLTPWTAKTIYAYHRIRYGSSRRSELR
jgi:mannosyltransferase OCH1-like enzyme